MFLLFLAASEFRAGFGSSVITPAETVPLAGFAAAERRLSSPLLTGDQAWHLFKPHEGVHDDVEAKAMVIEIDGRKAAFVGVDLIAVTADALPKIARQVRDLGYGEESLLVGASHTHSGPGAISPMPLWQFVAVDLYETRVGDGLIEAIALAIRRADAALAPAALDMGATNVDGVIVNRRGVDLLQPRLLVMRVDHADGTPMGVVYNFPIHGVSLGPDNMQLTADNIGYTRRAVEMKLGVPAVYLNGAEGDVTPIARGFDGAAAIGEQLSDALVGVFAGLHPEPTLTFDMQAKVIDLPNTVVHLQACDAELAQCLGPVVDLPFQVAEPRASLRVARFNDQVWVSVPGEAITEIGQDIEARVLNASNFRGAYVIGLANGHVGYLLSRAQYDRGGLESCTSIYGPEFGPWMVEQIAALAAVLNSGGGTPFSGFFAQGCSASPPAFGIVLAVWLSRRVRSAHARRTPARVRGG